MVKQKSGFIGIGIASIVLLFNCSTLRNSEQRALQKFEPADGKCLLFIGQDLGAAGGLPGYSDGYCDHFETPGGITVYLGLNPGGAVKGLKNIDNWGAGDCCADKYTQSGRFASCFLAIGLAIVGQETNIAQGKLDGNLLEIARWIKQQSPRPVFLRIGYEFDGHEWNHYRPETYLPAYRYIKDFIDNQSIYNIAYVWQSKGYGTSCAGLEQWYPGDEYVDWCGYSYFDKFDGNMIRFARRKGKPVFVAEATPVLKDDGKFADSDIKKPDVARRIWDEWFTEFFRILEENADVIKAFSYINTGWYAQPMWINDENFQQCDSRIQRSEYVSEKWRGKIIGGRYAFTVNLTE